MNMVEKVARALEDLPEHAGPYEWARTAIEAMRVPTEEMVKAGDAADPDGWECAPAISHWNAMIDAALKEEAK